MTAWMNGGSRPWGRPSTTSEQTDWTGFNRSHLNKEDLVEYADD